jgi:hypothetical protein
MSNWISSSMGMGAGGIPTTDNIPEKTEHLKHLILSYSLKIKLNTCRNNRNFISIYFKAKCQ